MKKPLSHLLEAGVAIAGFFCVVAISADAARQEEARATGVGDGVVLQVSMNGETVGRLPIDGLCGRESLKVPVGESGTESWVFEVERVLRSDASDAH